METVASAIKRSAFAVALFAAVTSVSHAQDAELIDAAKKEGTLTVYHATDVTYSKPLFESFTKKYGIAVVDMDLGVNTLYNRIISEAAASQVTADVAWSSAMDTMMVLAADGYTETYASAEAGNIPTWANYKDTVYATTVEPFGIVYNTDALKAEDLPKTYADMITFLKDNKDKLQGRVATFDPEKAGIGFLGFSNDSVQRSDFWDFAKALGATGVKLYSGSGSIKETVLSNENVLAVGIIGSYVFGWIAETPKLGVHFYTDYTPAFSRLAVIAKGAPHPNAAKLFVDFMLSAEGQTLIAQTGLPSVRSDLKGDVLNIDNLNTRVGGGLKPIPLDDKLLEYIDPTKRVGFLNEWKAAIGR